MINESLQFLAQEVNKYLDAKLPGPELNQPRLVVGNIALADAAVAPHPDVKNKAVLSLVNIEEDQVIRQQGNNIAANTVNLYTSRPVYLNLFVLFSINMNQYDGSLDFLSGITSFFQLQNVFTPATHPSLNSRIQKMVVDMQSINFEQLNYLWSILGGKYLPSVMYKVRLSALSEDSISHESVLINEVEYGDKKRNELLNK